MSESLKQKTFKGTIWSAVESFSVQGVQFLVMLVMARILTPADYGIIGMLAIFLAVSNTFINSGFSTALIRKKDRTELDKSTVFYFNIVVALLFYTALFFCAPLIARFYNEPILISVTRVIGLNLVIGAFGNVQRAHFAYRLDFKTPAKISFTCALVSSVVGISMAYLNFGVWALVWQSIVSQGLSVILVWCFVKWKPLFAYSWKSFKELFGFGSKLLASGLLDTLYSNIYQIVIGKIYKATDLGYYTRARGFSDMASSNITGILQKVTFPILCQVQDDDERLANGYRKLLRVSAFIIFPLMVGMASISYPLVITLITDKWIYTAYLLVPICFAGMWYPVHAINLNLLQVKGRSDLFLRLEIIKKLLGVSILTGTIPLGLYWMCWGSLLSSILCLIINTHYTGKLINLGFLKQMRDLFPILILSLGMGMAVWVTISILSFPQPALLTIGILEGTTIYIIGAKLFRFPEFTEIRSLLNGKKQ